MTIPLRLAILLLATLSCLPSFANDAPPSDASIAEMMRLSHAEENFASLKPQVEALMRKTLNEVSDGKQLNPAQQAAYERGRERMVGVMRARYNWDGVRDMYLRAYQAAFTQDELDGIIAFYRTPAGAAMVTKMPLLQQSLLQEMQAWMRPLVKEFQAVATDMHAEIERAAGTAK